MEQLKLKDITGYLPYGLKVKLKDEFISHLSRPKFTDEREFDAMSIHSVEFSYEDVYLSIAHDYKEFTEDVLIEDVLPILRPMSDLIKPMKHPDVNNDKKFTPIVELAKCRYYFSNNSQDKTSIRFLYFYDEELGHCVEYSDVQCRGLYTESIYYCMAEIELLNKLHFDYNNLISKELAIDINTLHK